MQTDAHFDCDCKVLNSIPLHVHLDLLLFFFQTNFGWFTSRWISRLSFGWWWWWFFATYYFLLALQLFSVMLGIYVNVMISSDDSNIKWTMNRTIIHCRSASRASEHHTNHALLVWTFFNNMPPSSAIIEFWHIEVFGLVWSGACPHIFSVYNIHVSVWETYCVLCLTGLSTWKMKAKATNHAFSSFITKYYTHTYKRHCWQKERS